MKEVLKEVENKIGNQYNIFRKFLIFILLILLHNILEEKINFGKIFW